MIEQVVVFFLFTGYVGYAQVLLEGYVIDPGAISISGFSSGAAMATQMHVAFSSKIMGVGMFAGAPYWCTKGSYTLECTLYPWLIDMSALVEQTSLYESQAIIDPTIHMSDSRVYLYHGLLDPVVVAATLPRVKEYYDNYVNPGNIKTVTSFSAGHGTPTSHYGVLCAMTFAPFINNCLYKGGHAALNHIYGNLQEPVWYGFPLPGEWHRYDQNEFADSGSASSISMDDVGYIYVPSRCTKSYRYSNGTKLEKCRLHIHLHGCYQGRGFLGDTYAKNIGFNEVGELNDIIMIYPQAAISFSLGNPMGCWDFWGYNNQNYANQLGPQMKALCRVIERLTGGIGSPCP